MSGYIQEKFINIISNGLANSIVKAGGGAEEMRHNIMLKTNDILESFEKEHTLEVEEEVVEGMYYGPVGDC